MRRLDRSRAHDPLQPCPDIRGLNVLDRLAPERRIYRSVRTTRYILCVNLRPAAFLQFMPRLADVPWRSRCMRINEAKSRHSGHAEAPEMAEVRRLGMLAD